MRRRCPPPTSTKLPSQQRRESRRLVAVLPLVRDRMVLPRRPPPLLPLPLFMSPEQPLRERRRVLQPRRRIESDMIRQQPAEVAQARPPPPPPLQMTKKKTKTCGTRRSPCLRLLLRDSARRPSHGLHLQIDFFRPSSVPAAVPSASSSSSATSVPSAGSAAFGTSRSDDATAVAALRPSSSDGGVGALLRVARKGAKTGMTRVFSTSSSTPFFALPAPLPSSLLLGGSTTLRRCRHRHYY